MHTVPGGLYELGWRHDAVLPPEVSGALDAFMEREEFMKAFSPRRRVQLESFRIATDPLDAEALLDGLSDDAIEAIDTVADLTHHLNAVLATRGQRLPTEDEFEAAVGGSLFAWGDDIPPGIPYANEGPHLARSASGLLLPHDTYQLEVVGQAFKMGDGGSAVCGSYPWPVAWLCLSPSARMPDEMLDDLFILMENAVCHPVALSD